MATGGDGPRWIEPKWSEQRRKEKRKKKWEWAGLRKKKMGRGKTGLCQQGKETIFFINF